MRPIPILRKPARSGRVRASGASLSAAQVVNAAAQVLSVRPDLDTADVVALLVGTATTSAQGLALLDARAAVAAAREQPAPPVAEPLAPRDARSTDTLRRSAASPDIVR